MAKRLIVSGDITTHGGRVIAGSSMMIVDGKPVALVGDLVSCSKCNGVYPIIMGTNQVFYMGKAVAVEGMMTLCGAVLIGSQDLAFVNEDDGVRSPLLSVKPSALDEIKLFDDYFQLVDSRHKLPLRNIEYAIKRANGEVEYGCTDGNGYTHLLKSTEKSEKIEIYVEI